MRNNVIKNICIALTTGSAVYVINKWYYTKELDYLALVFVILFPLIATLLPYFNRKDYIFKFEPSDWTQLPDGHFHMNVPYKVHGIENPKAVLYVIINNSLSRVSGSLNVETNIS
ncbi:hypothetical protein ACNFU2_00575 [Chryseobacterium sp. PTM-20240506]|uniref:hypothetical protein n=1 Tax=unclassified Chryseobacterium TaxID=2593645 RepID=UPI002358F596|nr:MULTISPECIES: hypothetical protein [unclassified Chryseobacterium]MDC8103382.1 hypothetical protein [Chryseobacterium sp. B21-037]MDQ1802936.1 hypothetical protein [Chryseobacterium sp. CKR4-1]